MCFLSSGCESRRLQPAKLLSSLQMLIAASRNMEFSCWRPSNLWVHIQVWLEALENDQPSVGDVVVSDLKDYFHLIILFRSFSGQLYLSNTGNRSTKNILYVFLKLESVSVWCFWLHIKHLSIISCYADAARSEHVPSQSHTRHKAHHPQVPGCEVWVSGKEAALWPFNRRLHPHFYIFIFKCSTCATVTSCIHTTLWHLEPPTGRLLERCWLCWIF